MRRVGGANRASFSGTWWVVVLTTWVGGAAGSDAGLAAQATPLWREEYSFRLASVVASGVSEGNRGGGGGGGGGGFKFRRWRVGGGQNHHAVLNRACGGGCQAWRRVEVYKRMSLLRLGHPRATAVSAATRDGGQRTLGGYIV